MPRPNSLNLSGKYAFDSTATSRTDTPYLAIGLQILKETHSKRLMLHVFVQEHEFDASTQSIHPR